VQSSPLVPGDDPTLLFTNAGMNQFKDVFLGRDRREYTRAATSQKVMRVSGKHNDLDNVGPSLRHHTFFEMLGNFSFGDYFKKEAIEFAWTLLTEVWKMSPDRMVVSVFKGENGIPRDAEAYDIWRRLCRPTGSWSSGPRTTSGRWATRAKDPEIEIWNNVFMEFERSSDGTLTPLPAPSIDTGMGLERITAVMQQKDSNYDTDLFMPLLTRVGELAGCRYGEDPERDVSMRVVADHARSTTFLIADGVIPSNEWRGYVLRKIMRRAMRHGKHLGLSEPFLHEMVAVLVTHMGDAYPELKANRDMVERTIVAEENRFEAVLTGGLPKLEAEIAEALNTPARMLSGDAAFRLYDTFGVPYDFIEDTAATNDVRVDREGFDRAMEAQRDKARAGSAFGGKKEQKFGFDSEGTALQGGDNFDGYEHTSLTGLPVLALWNAERQPVVELGPGHVGFVALPKTPFYLEAGGQVSDTGTISSASGATATVTGVLRTGAGMPRAHRVTVASGTLRVRDIVQADVDVAVRDATRRNHTATHLLHAALRQVLGAHVKQAGSLVAPDRLRFDFVHFQAITRDELDRIERIVNEQIVKNTPVDTQVRSTDEAIAAGAMALFGEKYGDRVRVVSVPGFSLELCGGTHVRATGDIGLFVIVAESGVAAGVRRIEALTGLGALTWAQQQRSALHGIVDALHVNPDQAIDAIEKLQAEVKKLGREASQLKTKLAMSGGGERAGADVVEVSGVKLARAKASALDKDAIRSLADSLKDSIRSGVVLVTSTSEDGKVAVVVSVTPDLTKRVAAGRLVKALAPIVGGGGGGRPDFAEAGGKDPSKVDELHARAPEILAGVIGG
jgi:alanyl-tRNA synthetase